MSQPPIRLTDSYGRVARDLRVSVTDRCNLRCTYCMPAEGMQWIEDSRILTLDELARLVRIGVEILGIRSVRFTGGEPLLRPGLEKLIAATSALTCDNGESPDISLTTNALSLARHIDALKNAGLKRINISLDSLDQERFAALTRRDRLHDVLTGLQAAKKSGLGPIKVNTVVMPNTNEEDIVPLLDYCLENGFQLRFIEEMPLGPPQVWDRNIMVKASDIKRAIEEKYHLTPASGQRASSPAKVWDVRTSESGPIVGQVGIIASVTKPFCGDCDRTRLTADGQIRNCLFSRRELNLRELLRGGASDQELAEAWAGEMARKLPGHGIDSPDFLQPQRGMSAIGG
ncbi:GTP 3',8-cyclase MoaA [Corynebacterium sp. H130]|uniref:GTP 3',8-cyclase MoaA n=1 Tax=Corynebacterium sp. H130 TaxID=3133444 RepID=UPI0030AB436A